MLSDFFGACVSFMSTLCFIRLNSKAWPIGLLATLVNGALYWYKGIYADMVLEAIYMIAMLYGWYLWSNHKYTNSQLLSETLNTLKPSHWGVLSLVSLAVCSLIYYLLTHYTDSEVAVLDALTTTMSLVAQYLMCHKIIFTWVLWFCVDLLYACMYFNKQLPFHTVLMLVYTGMALSGYWYWSKKSNNLLALVRPDSPSTSS